MNSCVALLDLRTFERLAAFFRAERRDFMLPLRAGLRAAEDHLLANPMGLALRASPTFLALGSN